MTEPGKPPDEVPSGQEVDNPSTKGMRDLVREAQEHADRSQAGRAQEEQDRQLEEGTESPG